MTFLVIRSNFVPSPPIFAKCIHIPPYFGKNNISLLFSLSLYISPTLVSLKLRSFLLIYFFASPYFDHDASHVLDVPEFNCSHLKLRLIKEFAILNPLLVSGVIKTRFAKCSESMEAELLHQKIKSLLDKTKPRSRQTDKLIVQLG